MKLFLDANIIFTAAYTPQGASGFLFSIAETGAITLCTSLYALDEAKRNLALKAVDKLPTLEKLLPHLTIVSEPQPEKVAWAALLPLPRKDAPIMAAAVSCKADILDTGDRRDFGSLLGTTTEGMLVLEPAETVRHLSKLLA
jgi:predicted nucleic acid-binding protein